VSNEVKSVSDEIKVLLMEQDIDYLKARGYTQHAIKTEELISVEAGPHEIQGIKFTAEKPAIVFVCRSMANTLIGLQVATRNEKNYRFYQHPDAKHLPIMYSTADDRRMLYETREMVLVEGVFDRIALKNVMPEWAVFARLSKGVGLQMVELMKRFTKTVWLCFDQDEAGTKGTEQAMKKLEGLEIYEIRYPAKDPSELVMKLGEKEVRRLFLAQMNNLRV